MKQVKREIRSGSLIGVAGVGAIVDVGDESFVVPGIDLWPIGSLRTVELKRLSSRLHKQLRSTREDASLTVRRFPRAVFCESCRRIVQWRSEMEEQDQAPSCPYCCKEGSIVPMRFVLACERGHLQDVPWSLWAHSGPVGDRGCRCRDKLEFLVDERTGTAGLGSLRVRCIECRSWRSLDGISSPQIVQATIPKCGGRHPWRHHPEGDCDCSPKVLQRGATNLHYPVTVSALDIPCAADHPGDWSMYVGQIRSHDKFGRLKGLMASTDGDNAEWVGILVELISGAVGCPEEAVLETARLHDAQVPEPASCSDAGGLDQDVLLSEEWNTLLTAVAAGGIEDPHFVASVEPLHPSAPAWVRHVFRGVLLIRRMREVRAYLGYHRVKPGNREAMVAPDVRGAEKWLPAMETYGEGIFLMADGDLLEEWASQLPASEAESLSRLEQHRQNENFWFLPPVNPVRLALHSLSHLILRRITFECGYTSSSLRERLYMGISPVHAGLMVYTSDADSEGSLGGLVRQGRRDRLAQTLLESVEQGRWCSADPVCSETSGQGLGGFNRAACHACMLVSETSCVLTNTLLDRSLLVNEQYGLIAFAEGKR